MLICGMLISLVLCLTHKCEPDLEPGVHLIRMENRSFDKKKNTFVGIPPF